MAADTGALETVEPAAAGAAGTLVAGAVAGGIAGWVRAILARNGMARPLRN